jgi:hypothetical protein
MTTRERWLTAGLILSALLLAGLGLWQHVRYSDAKRAAQEFVRLEMRIERPTEEDEDRLALARQARPEVRRSLARGDFGAALKRLQSLREEDQAEEDPEIRGKGVAVDELWPPGSPARANARKLLRTLAEKQGQGYEMGPARDALVRLADSARAGKKEEALAHFQEVATQVREAALRPGFEKPQAAAPQGAPAQLSRDGIPPVSGFQIQQGLAMLGNIPPHLLNRLSPAQQDFIPRARQFSQEAAAAHRQGRDVRSVFPVLERLGQAFWSDDIRQADRLLEEAREALRNAPRLAAGAPREQGSPLSPARQAGPPGPGMPGVPPPMLPPAGIAGAPGAEGAPERVLQALDMIRSIPEAEYRQRREQMAAMFAQVLAGFGGGRGPGPQAAPGPAAGVGDPAALRLELGPLGQVLGLRARGASLSAALPPGGFALLVDGDTPLRGPVKSTPEEVTQRAAGPQGVFTASYRREGEELAITARARRDRPGKAGSMALRIPLRAAGWRWTAAGEPQVIAVDDRYVVNAGPDEKLAEVIMSGAGVTLSIAAPTAAAVSYDPVKSLLELRFPIPAQKGAIEHQVRLTAPTPPRE